LLDDILSVKVPANKFIRPYVPAHGDYFDKITNKFYRSWYEVYVARFFRHKKIDFMYEEIGLRIGKTKIYTPDFFLPSKGLFVEVKGRWYMSAKTKFRNATNEFPIALLPAHLWKEFNLIYRMKSDVTVR
jgi:hypothetical protein